ncbi:cupin domain-containing protein [Conexibacter sp. SYSU D00693]|uniref:cupin domain-containing protein n=1 Tax=Conexibacter sp. SYSU D00693 TaxID=2812560 RepID=UPI00196A89E1|nr:cupin domain-containing protein [Conexibacter sp. SYSU D00693]
MAHPHVIHWDDVEAEVLDVGELRGAWRDLGTAAGSFRVGVQRAQVRPGARSTPVHVHGEEEELFFVLGGSGLLWQDGATCAIGAGDALCFRIHEEPHTLVAGDDGLDVLAFGLRHGSDPTWLPHAGVVRVGPHWIPADLEHPYAAEVAAGPLEVPLPGDRPPNVIALGDVPPSDVQRGPTNLRRHDLGTALGSELSGIKHLRVAAGARGMPHHWHSAEEELFVVLSGDGWVRLGDELVPVREGTVVARPPATGVAHSFHAGERGLELLAYGSRRPEDVCFYPDSQKLGIGPVRFRIEQVDYWDGEE